MIKEKLEQILSFADQRDRQTELIKLAAALNVDISGAKDNRGEYNEEKLVIAIVKEADRQKNNFVVNTKFVISALILSILTIFLIVLLPKLISRISDDEKNFPENNTVFEEEPAVFQVIDGSYKTFDKRGNLQAEYYYEQGKLLWGKEYDSFGNLAAEHKP